MSYGFVTAAYIAASVLFILSLGGLSNQESAKRAATNSGLRVEYGVLQKERYINIMPIVD